MSAHPRHIPLYVIILAVVAAPVAFLPDPAWAGFRNVGAERGIDVLTASLPRADYGSGVAFTDFDGDGDLDLYIVMGDAQPNRLYENNGAGMFVDNAVELGCADPGWGKSIKFADYDNDGDQDMFLTNNEGPNRLFENDGSGNFYDVTTEAGLSYSGPTHGAAWGDYDQDGFLDLYVVNRGQVPNLLYRNNRDGSFSEMAAEAHAQDALKPGFECVWLDYDNDGDLDIYIAVDKNKGNTLLRNEGDGTFADVSAVSGAGVAMNGMGVTTGDYDNDGDLDIYVTNTEEGNVLLRNSGTGSFDNVALSAGVVSNRIGWGTSFFDYDNDGDLDLYVVNWSFAGGDQSAENILFSNNGAGVFSNVTGAMGAGNRGRGYGLGIGDYNDDGALDMFVVNRDDASVLYEGAPTAHNWLKVKTIGRLSNRDGIGARVTVTSGGASQIREVSGGSSYLSQNSLEVEFGLRDAAVAEVVEVRWPSGTVDRYTDVPVNQTLQVRETETAMAGTFIELTATSGIDVTPLGTSRDFGFGTAFTDYNGDGHLDLYVASGENSNNWFFRGSGEGFFQDIAPPAGVALPGNTRGVKFADYDNDGDQDFFVGMFRLPNKLFRNNGDGTFTNVAGAAGVSTGNETYGGCWGDYNQDGHLDLYVVNRREPNQFYHNNGDGTFTERATEWGLDDPMAGLEAVWFDFDNDGDQDLYLSNDKLGGNRLWRNDGGTFTDISAASGSDVEINSMGVAIGDYNFDGFLDLYITNTPEGNVFLRNNGDGTFTDVAAILGMSLNRIGWGTAFFDYDNDTDIDLYVVNWGPLGGGGMASPKNMLYSNDGDGTFTKVTDLAGVGDRGPGYGLAVGDYNDDGYLDMFVSNNSAPAVFYENVPSTNGWLKVRTVGIDSNRDGIGARVTAVTGSITQVREVRGGSSYLSQNSLEVEFGLGNFATIDRLEIRWPSGVVDEFTNVARNQTLNVVEGSTAPLVITVLNTTVKPKGVELAWELSRDASIQGFRIYRTPRGGSEKPAGGLVGSTVRYYFDRALTPGTYDYVIAAVMPDDSEVRSDPAEVMVGSRAPLIPLVQNFPNPFSGKGSTRIRVELQSSGPVKLYLYDVAGRLVRRLVDANLFEGNYDFDWDGTDFRGNRAPSGIYFYKLTTGGESFIKRLVLVR